MWCRLFITLLVVAVSGEHAQAWKINTQYEYNVRGRTLTALHDFSNQYTGIILRAQLIIRPNSEDLLEAKLSRPQYAQIHTKLPDGWKSEIPNVLRDLKPLPISEKVFKIKIRHGVVRDLIVDKNVSNWEINVLKSIVSQIQVDTQGENIITHQDNQSRDKKRVNVMFKTMEDTVGGKCEVLYDIKTLPESVVRSRPELNLKSELRGRGRVIEVTKTKNYCKCEDGINYHFGTIEKNNWKQCTKENGKLLSKSSVSHIVVTGTLDTFTIQSSIMNHEVILSPNLHEDKKGMVGSRINVTLEKMVPASSDTWTTSENYVSVGNLVYSYNDSYTGPGEHLHETFNSERKWDDRNASNGNSSKSHENRSYWQSASNLNEATFTPLLPLFMNNEGKLVSTSSEVEAVTISIRLANQIGDDLENPNNIVDEQTLEKFTVLTGLIRTMNTQQIGDVQLEIYQYDNELDSGHEGVRRNNWVAFRDAVAQAGTGPALLTIKNWIRMKIVEGIEAAAVVAVLSKTARAPTSEYVDTFFEMATMPETTEQEFLNSTAMITFAELVRYSQQNYDQHPEKSFVDPSPKPNPSIFHDYIPYMSKQLKKSLEKNEFAKAHVFIHALGNIAHPRILNVFQPYLEGKIAASTFQRILMIFSMKNLASLRPRLARDVFYGIYENIREPHQLRSAAVTFLIGTNPPAIMLQKMVEFSNHDPSKQVKAAIRSAVESASKLETPESQDFATKARNVLSLLPNETYDNANTINYFSDYAASEWNLAYRTQAYMAIDDLITLALYGSLEAKYGDFEIPKFEIGGLLSSLKDLYGMVWNRFENPNGKDRNIEFSPENIARMLKLEIKNDENLEGTFWMNSKYNNKFMSFDKRSIQRIPDLVRKAADSIKKGRNFNVVKMDSYDLTLSFPMESGFPFLYTMKIPTMLKLSGSIKSEGTPIFTNGTVNISLVYSMQKQGRLGFITPFEDQHYMAGVNKNLQAYASVEAQVNYDRSSNRITVQVRPSKENETYRLAHYSLVPFTSRRNILDLSPVMRDNETRKLINGKVWHRSTCVRNLTFVMEAGSSTTLGGSIDRSTWDPIARLMFLLAEDNPEYSKADIYLEPDETGHRYIILNAAFDSRFSDATMYNEGRSKLSPKAKAPTITSRKLNDLQRIKELMDAAMQKISDVSVIGVDLGVELPGKEPSGIVLTAVYANSLIDQKSRGLVYCKVIDPQWQVELETCAGLEFKSPRMYSMAQGGFFPKDIDKFRSFDVDLLVGATCDTGYKIQIHGDQEQTEQYERAVHDLPILEDCLNDVMRGGKFTVACKDAGDKIYTMDKSHMVITFDPEFHDFQEEVPKYLAIITSIFPGLKSSVIGKIKNNGSIGHNVLEFFMNVNLTNNVANFSCESSDERLLAEDLTIPLKYLVMNSHLDLSDLDERYIMNLTDMDPVKHTCEFNSNKTTTFDKETYPIDLAKCWHVAMTNYPGFKFRVMTHRDYVLRKYLTILVRDSTSINNESKDIQIIIGSHEVMFTLDDSKIRVTMDGHPVDFSQKNNDTDSDIELSQESDGSIKFTYPYYELDVVYYGNRVLIKASEDYRNDIRGLCGNYDGERGNDFMNIEDCTLRSPEQFVSSFALTSIECEGPALVYSHESNYTDCYHKTIRAGNVVINRDGKKTLGSGKSKRCAMMLTKMIDDYDKICFSMRPMLTCSTDCKASRTKSKEVPVRCMPKGTESQLITEGINQGNNPDFTGMMSSKTYRFEIPVHCYAA